MRLKKKLFSYFQVCLLAFMVLSVEIWAQKLRVVIMSDISNEPDDQMSLVRFLTYSNEFDVEGLIATTSCWKRDNPDVAAMKAVIDAYGKDYEKLKLHSPDYPTADYLKSITKAGVNGYGMSAAEKALNNEGINHIISVLEKDDPRPVWFCAWGGANTLGGAVMKIKDTKGNKAEQLVSKIRGYEIALQDDGFAYIMKHFPNTKLISSRVQWKGISKTTPNFNAWSESWGGNNDVFNANWVSTHVQNNHGELGKKYPNAIYLYEGDTPSFLYLIPNGLHFPEFVHYGGWGGRFKPEREKNVRSGTGNNTVDGLLDKWKDYYLYTDAADSWKYNNTEYKDNIYCPVFRWREAFQWDFAARMDRCVKTFAEVNHAPIAACNGDTTKQLITINAEPGSLVTLDASASVDPDKNQLSFLWWVYKEPGTYNGTVQIDNASTAKATVRVPADAQGKNFHVILTVKDNGNPALESYRRIVITGGTPLVLQPVITPNGGTFNDSVVVTLSCSTPGATIRYTTDNSAVTAQSTQYTTPFVLKKSATVKAKAFKDTDQSTEVSAIFTIKLTTGVVFPLAIKDKPLVTVSNRSLSVAAELADNATITVKDPSGRVVLKKKCNGQSIYLDNCSAGIYFAEIKTPNVTFCIPLLLN